MVKTDLNLEKLFPTMHVHARKTVFEIKIQASEISQVAEACRGLSY